MKKRNIYDFKSKKIIPLEDILLLKELCRLTSRILFFFFLGLSLCILFFSSFPYSYGYSFFTFIIGLILSKTIPYSQTFKMIIKKEIRKQEKE